MARTTVRAIDFILESLRKHSPQTLAELERNTGVNKKTISSTISVTMKTGVPIARLAHGTYAYVGSDEIWPTSPAPVSNTYVPAVGTSDLRIVGYMADGSVLLQDASKDLWKATRA